MVVIMGNAIFTKLHALLLLTFISIITYLLILVQNKLEVRATHVEQLRTKILVIQ